MEDLSVNLCVRVAFFLQKTFNKVIPCLARWSRARCDKRIRRGLVGDESHDLFFVKFGEEMLQLGNSNPVPKILRQFEPV